MAAGGGSAIETEGMGRRFPVPDPHKPLIEELTPAPEPWDVCLRLAGLSNLLFLDSAIPGGELGRYSFLTAEPFSWLWSRGRQVWLDGVRQPIADPFTVLAEQRTRWPTETIPDLPPFQGGAAGLFGYNLCHHLERLPRPHFDEFQVPDLALGFYDWVISFDHLKRRAWIVSTGFPETEPARRWQRAGQRLTAVRRWLNAPPLSPSALCPPPSSLLPLQAPSYPLPGRPGVLSNFDRAGYLAGVRRAVEYVHAGDCFQVNLSQRLLHQATLPPLELYRRLRERNAAPFGGYFDLGDFVVASASPERFVRVVNGAVETRPIKGTRPRGPTPEEDRRNAEELLNSVKDRAENVMIVDLMRNDLGRVCAYGSVRVESLCRLESYRTVHHLVSEVRGRLREGKGPVDLLRAAFPGGSVTGAPKVRAMEIIAELEPTARGPYCGSLGYVGFNGAMDVSILIRTCTMGRGWVQFPVGGGIVADSRPDEEYEETLHKAEGLLRALRP
jgi:para-aminobenzoate synthetase component I